MLCDEVDDALVLPRVLECKVAHCPHPGLGHGQRPKRRLQLCLHQLHAVQTLPDHTRTKLRASLTAVPHRNRSKNHRP